VALAALASPWVFGESFTTRRALGVALGLAAMCAVGLGAQSGTTETKTKTKIDVKDGKNITISGCLAANPGGGYMLTTRRGEQKYALVTDDDMAKYLDHRVQVTGKATNQGNGEVKLQTTTKLDNREQVGTTGQSETKTTTEAKGTIAMRFTDYRKDSAMIAVEKDSCCW